MPISVENNAELELMNWVNEKRREGITDARLISILLFEAQNIVARAGIIDFRQRNNIEIS